MASGESVTIGATADSERRVRWLALVLVSVVHGAALGMLLERSATADRAAGAPRLLAVSWLAAPETPAPRTAPEPARQPEHMRRRTEPSATPPQPAAVAPPPMSAASAEAAPAAQAFAESGNAAIVGAAPAAVFVPPRFEAAYLSNPAPAYPSASRARGEQGRVLLRVFVTTRGEAGEVVLHASSGFDRLDSAALDAVGRWKFAPAQRGDEAVAAWVQVPISFSLRR